MVNKIIIWSSILFLLFSCEAKVPEDVVDKDTMENLLYDYHLAQALAKKEGDSVDYRTRLYTDAVYRKYGLSEDQFNHTMEWYTRNSEILFKIYKKVDDKFATTTFANKHAGNRFTNMRAEGDTMNIWRGKNFYMLTSTWRNHMNFTQMADSSFAEGDRLLWQFDTHWYYHEGQKSALAQLAVVYENDSVASTSSSIYSTGLQDVSIKIGNKPIKSIHGFIYQQSEWTELPRILVVTEPVLVRFKHPRNTSSISNKNVAHATSADSASLVGEKSAEGDSETEEIQEKRRIRPIEPKARHVENPRILPFPKAND